MLEFSDVLDRWANETIFAKVGDRILRNLKSNNVFGPIGIVDYLGNLHSVWWSLRFLGAEVTITTPEDFEQFEFYGEVLSV